LCVQILQVKQLGRVKEKEGEMWQGGSKYEIGSGWGVLDFDLTSLISLLPWTVLPLYLLINYGVDSG
jgi:hypothetical protein